MTTPKNTKLAAFDQYIIDCIDGGGLGYDSDEWREDMSDKEKVEFFHTVFMQEYGWRIKQKGSISQTLTEYCQGLPSFLGIAFMNVDVLEVMREVGYYDGIGRDIKQDTAIEKYWQALGMRSYVLFKKHGLEK